MRTRVTPTFSVRLGWRDGCAPVPTSAGPRTGTRAGAGGPDAVRRARHAARAGRGDRTRRGDGPRPDLPQLLVEGGAVRPRGDGLPDRARRGARGVDRPRA